MKKKFILIILIIIFLAFLLGFYWHYSQGKSKPVKILCIGDSITESSYGSYPKYLRALLKEYGIKADVISAARPGNTSGEYLRFLKRSEILKKSNPSIVLIMLGTNDVRIDSDRTSKKKFILNMKEIIRIVKKYGERKNKRILIFLLTPPPIFNIDIKTFDESSKKRLKKEIVPAIRGLARKNNLKLIDTFSFMKNKKSLIPGIHPSQEGFYKMAKFIYKNIIPYIKGFPPKTREKLPEIFKGKIVFQSDRSGNEDIFLINHNGVEQLTRNRAFDGFPTFSPDGNKIVFESNRSGRFEIYTMDLRDKKITRLFPSPSEDRAPFWSYDEKYIFFSRKVNGREQIFKYDFSNKKVVQITNFKGKNILPAVSPDNKYLLFTSNKFIGWNVYLMNLVTGDVRKFSEGYGGCRGRFSHSGNYIAWVSHKYDHKGDIILTPFGKFSPVRLTLDSQKHDYFPAFSPDDRYIVYASGPKLKSGNYDIKIIEIKSGKIWQITSSPAKDMMPYWGK